VDATLATVADRWMTRAVTRSFALVVVASALVAGCSSSGTDDVVSAGPAGSGNPQTPAVDNPTTTTSTPLTVSTTPGSTTTTDPDAAASTSVPTSATSVPVAVTVPGNVLKDTSLTMQLFWVRTPDDPRVLDLPGYRDPESGPKPLVIYGSATNDTAEPVVNPGAIALFADAAGAPVALWATSILLPGSTTPASVLAPGESGDVIVVISASEAGMVADLTPELLGGSA
jgi:hypothetical protein